MFFPITMNYIYNTVISYFGSNHSTTKTNISSIEVHNTTELEQLSNGISIYEENNTNVHPTMIVLFTIVSSYMIYIFLNKKTEPTPKQLIYHHFTREIKQHIVRNRISALYYSFINVITILFECTIIYLACPDLFVLIGFIDNIPSQYEGYSFTLDYVVSSIAEMTKIILSYIPIISQAIVLVNAIINVILTLVGLYIFYRVFLSTILHTLHDFFMNMKIVLMGRDDDYAILHCIERLTYQIYLLYVTKKMELTMNGTFIEHTTVDKNNLLLNMILNDKQFYIEYRHFFDELEKVSTYIVKSSLENKYMFKSKEFIENHLEIKTCIEALFNETHRRFQSQT